MPLILGTNSIKDTGYDVANSCRFNGASDDSLNRTLGTPTNNYKWTISFWLKRTELGVEDAIMTSFTNTQNRGMLLFRTDDQLEILDLQSDSYVMQKKTNRKFRDVSAWYHIVISSDATLSSPETKFYVNGVEETSFATTNEYTQNQANKWNSAIANYIGNDSSTRDFSGYLAEFVFIDGQALAADQFGEFDEDTGIWKPIDVSGLTFGTNGFYLDFENSGSLGADVSGNGNNFTVNNLTSIDQSTDTCTNNFATINSLDKNLSDVVLSEGNLKMTTTAVNKGSRATIGVSSGKWFWEIKIGSKGNNDILIGIAQPSNWSLDYVGSSSTSYSYASSAQKYNNASQSSYGASFTTDDIIGVALNMDDGEIAFYKNGSSQGTAYTGIPTTDFILPAFSGQSGSGVDTDFSVNFGSPPYSESGGNSDGNGYGNFSMSVPSGYYSLNTKNLSEFG